MGAKFFVSEPENEPNPENIGLLDILSMMGQIGLRFDFSSCIEEGGTLPSGGELMRLVLPPSTTQQLVLEFHRLGLDDHPGVALLRTICEARGGDPFIRVELDGAARICVFGSALAQLQQL